MHKIKKEAIRAGCELARNGLDKVTFASVGRAIHASPQRVTYHFGTKSALLAEIGSYALQHSDSLAVAQFVAARHPAVAAVDRAAALLALA